MAFSHVLLLSLWEGETKAICVLLLQEFDAPTTLLGRPTSMFNKLVDDTGPHASASLRRMAAEGPQDDDV